VMSSKGGKINRQLVATTIELLSDICTLTPAEFALCWVGTLQHQEGLAPKKCHR